jgi:hypothetical protein
MAGGVVASFLEGAFGLVSKKLGHAVGHRVRTFRAGLDTMRSFADFGVVTLLSLTMWGLIALAYLETTRAFVASPELSSMTLPRCMLLLAFSGGASILQLPVLGWFTQIGLVAAAMVSFYGAAPEASTACAATLLLVTFLGIVPVGLIWAQFEHVSLRKVAVESGHAHEDLPEGTARAKAGLVWLFESRARPLAATWICRRGPRWERGTRIGCTATGEPLAIRGSLNRRRVLTHEHSFPRDAGKHRVMRLLHPTGRGFQQDAEIGKQGGVFHVFPIHLRFTGHDVGMVKGIEAFFRDVYQERFFASKDQRGASCNPRPVGHGEGLELS